MRYSTLSSLLPLLGIFPFFTKAIDLNCTEASFLILSRSEALGEAYIAMFKYMMDMCNHQPNDVCSWTNVTDGTDVHLRATINLTSMEADDTINRLKSECKNAGGKYVLETFDIGFKSESDHMQYYSFETGMYMPLYDSKYFDVTFIGSPDCADLVECRNETELSEFIKFFWDGSFNASIYNFTLHNFIWENTTDAKALDLNCTEASSLIFLRSEVLGDAYMAMLKYMMDMCNRQPNKVCSWTNVTDGTEVHLRATINMTSMEADETINRLKSECKNAGGKYVLETFDIGLKSSNDYMQYYSVEKDSYVPLNHSKYFDVYIAGYTDCVNGTVCKNASQVMEITKLDWESYFNASIYNLTLKGFILENSTVSSN